MSKTFEDAIAALVAVEGGQEFVDAVNARLGKVNSEAKGLRDRLHKTELRLSKVFEASGIDPETGDDDIENVFKTTKQRSVNSDTELKKLQKQVNELTERERIAVEKHQNSVKTTKILESLGSLKVLDEWKGTIKDVLSSKVKFNGEQMVFVSEDGSEVDFEEGVKSYVSKNPRLISSDVKEGSGTKPPSGTPTKTRISRNEFNQKSPVEQMQISKDCMEGKGEIYD
jgi:hypothetical protein